MNFGGFITGGGKKPCWGVNQCWAVPSLVLGSPLCEKGPQNFGWRGGSTPLKRRLKGNPPVRGAVGPNFGSGDGRFPGVSPRVFDWWRILYALFSPPSAMGKEKNCGFNFPRGEKGFFAILLCFYFFDGGLHFFVYPDGGKPRDDRFWLLKPLLT